MRVFASKSNQKFVSKIVLAVGGGSIIDEAKIYAKKHKMYCIAIPTTAAGATATSHGVVWDKTKKDIKTDIPYTLILDNYPKYLPKKVLKDTIDDCRAHIYESLKSIYATKKSVLFAELALQFLKDYYKHKRLHDLLIAGHLAGCAIEITGTNIIHKMSYPLTLRGWTHGKAVGFVHRLLCGNRRHIARRAYKIPRKMWK